MTLCCLLFCPAWMICLQRVLVVAGGKGKGKVGAGRFGWTTAKGGYKWCSVIALGENLESGYGGTERVEDVHGQPTWFYDRHDLHFSSLLHYLEQNVC